MKLIQLKSIIRECIQEVLLESNVFDKHQKRIAQKTLKMPDAMVGVMGGPSKEEAREILKRLNAKKPQKEATDPSVRKQYDVKPGEAKKLTRNGYMVWAARNKEGKFKAFSSGPNREQKARDWANGTVTPSKPKAPSAVKTRYWQGVPVRSKNTPVQYD